MPVHLFAVRAGNRRLVGSSRLPIPGRGLPALIAGLTPLPHPRALSISGITRDSAGTPLASCVVELYRTLTDVVVDSAASDGSGAFTFRNVGLGQTYYIVSYKAGSPDVFGTSLNTLAGA